MTEIRLYQACVLLLVFLAIYVIVSASKGETKNPNTGCLYSEVLTKEGVCR